MTLKKIIVRIVGLADRNIQTDTLFQEFKIIELMKIHAYKVVLAMYQVKVPLVNYSRKMCWYTPMIRGKATISMYLLWTLIIWKDVLDTKE